MKIYIRFRAHVIDFYNKLMKVGIIEAEGVVGATPQKYKLSIFITPQKL